jgi:hypothetical protein
MSKVPGPAVTRADGRPDGSGPSHLPGGFGPGRDHCLSLVRAVDRPTGAARYGRMFPGLDPLGTDTRSLMRAGGDGGICDAAAALDGLGPGDDATEAAGWPFFGQLIAHDITADRSPIADGVDPEALRNARAPKLNLEMLYSDGPIGMPYLFDRDDPAKFLLGPDGRDVPRNQQGVALIGDPRNDVHLFALTMHIVLLRAHNRIVDLLRADGVPEVEVFDRARIALTWHYQWIVVHDFLPRLVGARLVQEVLAEGGRWFAPAPLQAYIPLEFADAAFRYGHSQIRHTYRLVEGGPAVPLFPDLVAFGPLASDRGDAADRAGGGTGLAARYAAVVLRPQGGGAPRRWRPARPGRRPDRGRGPDWFDARGRGELPEPGTGLGADPARRRPGLPSGRSDHTCGPLEPRAG